MTELDKKYFVNREQFRHWLEGNFDKSPGIWLIFYKKHIDIECIKYTEALEEALCFGWIDSIIKRVDNDCYIRKFTPRTNNAKWSGLNKKIVSDLIKRGIMTEAGLRKIDIYQKTGKVEWDHNELKEKRKIPEIPEFIINAFAKNEPALTNFKSLSPTYKRHYVLWITSAKKNETITKRLKESVDLLKENRKLGLK